MVLSHRKLKQKLRAAIGDASVSSEAQVHDSGINLSHPEAPPKPPKSAEPASQDSGLSKRRKKVPQENGGGDAKKEGSDKVVESKKNKRKREEEERMRALEERRLLKRQKREDRKKKDPSLQENGAGDAKVEKGEEGAVEGSQGSKHRKVKKLTKWEKKKIQKKKKKEKKNVDDAKGEQGFLSAENVEVAAQNVIMETPSISTTTISEVSADVSTKVCVGGIPYYSTEDDIRSFFESCGTITEIDCMTFPDTGKFRGIAIMNFKTEAAAKRALALDGSDMGGFFLKIQPYKPSRAEKAPKFSPIVVVEGYNRIYAGNLSYDITEEDLRNFFSDCNITSIRFGEDKETKEFRGYAHIDFSDSASLNLALKLDQRIVCGRPIRISPAVPPKRPVTTSTNNSEVRSMEVANAVVPSAAVVVPSAAEVVPSAAEVVPAVSGKIRRRTCYDCGGRGHLSSDCPKKLAENAAKAMQKSGTEEKEADVPSVAFAVVPSTAEVAEVSGKIRRRTCYECGERGHLSSACPKKKAEDAAAS